MKQTHTDDTPTSTVDLGAGTSAVSEPSFVEALVDPASVFHHPQEVVQHPWFTDQEKRAVLLYELVAEQLACAAAPELELASRIDAVIEALAHYDPLAASEYRSALATIRRNPGPVVSDLMSSTSLGSGCASSIGWLPIPTCPPFPATRKGTRLPFQFRSKC